MTSIATLKTGRDGIYLTNKFEDGIEYLSEETVRKVHHWLGWYLRRK